MQNITAFLYYVQDSRNKEKWSYVLELTSFVTYAVLSTIIYFTLLECLTFVHSRPLQLDTELIFTYETGFDGETFVQRYEIVEPLPNVTVDRGTNVTELVLVAVHAGKVTIGLNKTSPEFDM